MKYSIFNIESGAIERVVILNDVTMSIHEQLQPGEWYVEDQFDDDKFKVEVAEDGLDVVPLVIAEDLDAIKRALLADIDADAGALRKRHVTFAPGMDLVYSQNQAEALRYFATVDPVDDDFPMLQAVAASQSAVWGVPVTVDNAAYIVDANATAWARTIHPMIEMIRIPAKAAIEAATTSAEARAIAAGVDWSAIP